MGAEVQDQSVRRPGLFQSLSPEPADGTLSLCAFLMSFLHAVPLVSLYKDTRLHEGPLS